MPATPANPLNITAAGVISFDGTATFSSSALTQHDVLVGGASNAITSVTPSTAGLLLTSNGTSADPSFQALTTTGTFSPTVVGQSTAGTTTYTSQNGYYITIGGNLAIVWGTVVYSAATGTGNLVLGALPFTIKNQTNYDIPGAIILQGPSFPANSVSLCYHPSHNTTSGVIAASISNAAASAVQISNTATTIWFNIMYQY